LHSLPPSNQKDSSSMKNRQGYNNGRPNEGSSAADYDDGESDNKIRGSNRFHDRDFRPNYRRNLPTASQASYEDENDSNHGNLRRLLPSYRQTPRFVASHREEVRNHDATLNQDPSNLDSHRSANANPFLSG